MDSKRLETAFFFLLLLCALVLAFFVFLPYLSALILAATFAVVFQPVQRKFLKTFSGHEVLAATSTFIVILIIVFLPLIFLGEQLFTEVVALYEKISSGSIDVSQVISVVLPGHMKGLVPEISFNITQYARIIVDWAFANITGIFSSITGLFLQFFIGFLALYYFLKDGPRFKEAVKNLFPLAQEDTEKIFTKLYIAVNSVIWGTLVVAIVHGIITGIGLLIFGVPNATFWGFLAVIAALIPIFGTALVIVPAVLYLFAIAHTQAAIGLLIWGVLAIGFVDNILGSKLIQKKVNIHPLFVLLSVLGGISFMGALGFLMGPLILSFLFALLDIYPTMIAKGRT